MRRDLTPLNPETTLPFYAYAIVRDINREINRGAKTNDGPGKPKTNVPEPNPNTPPTVPPIPNPILPGDVPDMIPEDPPGSPANPIGKPIGDPPVTPSPVL